MTLEASKGAGWEPKSQQHPGPGGGKGQSKLRQQQRNTRERGYKNKISKTRPMSGLGTEGNGGVHEDCEAPSQANCRNDKNNTRNGNGPLSILLLKQNDGNLFSTQKYSAVTISIDLKVKKENFKNSKICSDSVYLLAVRNTLIQNMFVISYHQRIKEIKKANDLTKSI